ncbi:hypothetical protein AJ78_07643 [Emergomyces pasteurianus Ep9510]|uniref:Uncharacterized protein n=1 Tax=Emergomyces pasteurianus Ep9510 TaxID=1447872 RepID=A0A1J9Q6R9_9EURO|nr:hypothetical protein AJ78_07643 [Emergomyces pasteurianus Ep9510]
MSETARGTPDSHIVSIRVRRAPSVSSLHYAWALVIKEVTEARRHAAEGMIDSLGPSLFREFSGIQALFTAAVGATARHRAGSEDLQ